MNAFWLGLPSWMYINSMPAWLAYSVNDSAVNTGPLSRRMACARPYTSTSWFITRKKRAEGIDLPHSIRSRMASSITFKVRNVRPS